MSEAAKKRGEKAYENQIIVHGFVRENPGVGMEEVVSGLCAKFPRKTTRNIMRTLRRYDHFVVEGHGKATIYTVVAQTLPPMQEIVYSSYRPRTKSDDTASIEAVAVTDKPWITRNISPTRMPIKNQGGQGNMRREVRTGSSLGW